MAQYLLKGPDADFDRWRSAAGAQGFKSLAAFLRAGADALAAGPSAFEAQVAGCGSPEHVRVVDRAAASPATAVLLAQIPERVFRPDPRPSSAKKGRR